MTSYTTDHAVDEFGVDRYFVAAPSGSWVDGPYDTVDQANDRAQWRNRKRAGERVASYLGTLPVGTEFTLEHVSIAYVGTYRKNAEGTWDQVAAPLSPLVINMDAAHLGFVVGEEPVRKAIRW